VSSMVIVCGDCGARFRMNHALFRDAKGARIRCRKCGGHIEVWHPEASPVSPAPEVPDAVKHEPAPTAVPAIREVVPKEGPVTSPVSSTEIPFPHAPSSDEPVPPVKPEPEAERASCRREPSMLTIFLLVVPGILLLAGGAFYFRDTKPAQELLRKFFPPSGSGDTARDVSAASAVEKPAYEIRDMKSSYARTFIGGNLFVIQGTVANVGKGPSRGIRVQATLLDKDNQALVNNTAFAANLVDNTMLRHANRAVIEGFLGVRHGGRNVNRDIPAGASLPFMVVFFDPPGELESFTVEALDTE